MSCPKGGEVGRVLRCAEGKEQIAFNRLRDGALSTNMIAACCKTLLCVEHPRYEGQSVLLFPDFCPISGLEPLPAASRVHIRDWPAEAYAKLPSLPGTWREDGRLHAETEEDKVAVARNTEAVRAKMLGSGARARKHEVIMKFP